jgi:hypothetical protein
VVFFFYRVGFIIMILSPVCRSNYMAIERLQAKIPKKLICGVQMEILSTYAVSRFPQISSSSRQICCFCSRMYVCWGGGAGLTSPSILVCEGGEETAIHNSASFT